MYPAVIVAMDFINKMTIAGKEDLDEWGDQKMSAHSVKKQKRAESSQSQGTAMQDLTMQLDTMKLVSNVEQKLRVHASVLMWTVMVPAALVQPAIDFAKEFGKSNKGKNAGSPHVQIWRMVFQTVVKTAKGKIESLIECEEKTHLTQATALIESYLQALTASGPKKGYYHVRQCMVRTTRSEKESILKFELSQLATDLRSTQMAILYVLEALDGKVLEGTEAATDLERKLQVHIAELKGNSDA